MLMMLLPYRLNPVLALLSNMQRLPAIRTSTEHDIALIDIARG
jgi:hypothetical protein